MAKRSTTIGIIVGIVVALVVIGIVGVVAVPRVWGAQGFCDEVTGVRLQLTQALVDSESETEYLEAQQSLAQETAGDLQSRADRVRFPSGAGDDADAVAEAWQAVADADDDEQASAAAREFFTLDDELQADHCGGPPTAEDLGG